MTFTEKKWKHISIRDYASFENVFSFYWKGSRIKMKSEIISKVVKKDSAIKKTHVAANYF